MGDRAYDLQHPLLPFFGYVNQQFDQAQKQGLSKQKELRAVENKVVRTLTVYPATEDSYAGWESFHDPCLYIAARSLDDPKIRYVAALDFIFRIYEFLLEKDDPDQALHILQKRVEYLGSYELLLPECALNRFTMALPKESNLVTNSLLVVAILAHIGKPWEAMSNDELRAEELSFFLFDNVIAPYVPPIRGNHIGWIAELMDTKSEELDKMRKKCRRVAWDLIDGSLSEPIAKAAIQYALGSMEEEVSAVADLTKSSYKNLVQDLIEDRVFWTTSTGFLGSLASPLPAEVAASLALTAFSTVGTKLVKAHREHREALKSTPWSFVYHLTRKPLATPLSLP